MDALMAIFSQLGINSTIAHQFVIVIVLFIVLSLLFVNKLQRIIELREEKTIKLEGSADNLFEEVQNLEAEYENKIQDTYVEAQNIVSKKKAEVLSQTNTEIKKVEQEVEAYIKSERDKNVDELNTKKEGLVSKTDSLVDTLVSKMTH
jgi:F0F1-type ATP synthase membrane subunit b/b'